MIVVGYGNQRRGRDSGDGRDLRLEVSRDEQVLAFAESLIRAEEKELVFDDRAAEDAAELFAVEVRLIVKAGGQLCACSLALFFVALLKEIQPSQILIAIVEKSRPV